jgi:hypothetical protein
MKKMLWFTATNLDTNPRSNFSIDLTEYIKVFIENKLWDKAKYRIDYSAKFTRDHLEKLTSFKVHFHSSDGPYSNFHSYEGVLSQYFDLGKIEKMKIASSGISEARRIAVIEIDFESPHKIIDDLSYLEEKQVDLVFGRLSDENHDAWIELLYIKSIACEFVQFLNFNLHLNYMTQDYSFSFEEKSNPIGFTITSVNDSVHYSTDRTDLLSHYVLYDKETDILKELMKDTAQFWCTNISSIHFFLDALRGSHITSTNFTKLVFTLESFFGERISNDFITLTVPLVLCTNISEMKEQRALIRECFQLRNDIVHGNSIINLTGFQSKRDRRQSGEQLFFRLKNLIICIFFFYMNNKLFERNYKVNIDHELIFELLPTGINSSSSDRFFRISKTAKN